MLYELGTTKEVAMLPNHLPEQLLREVFTGLVVLDKFEKRLDTLNKNFACFST